MGRYYDDFAHDAVELDEEQITHYGVLGMKWGVRRYQPYSYTGGHGKEVGEAKKLAKIANKRERMVRKSEKLSKKIAKLDKRSRNKILYNNKSRIKFVDKERKLQVKKNKLQDKINKIDQEEFKKPKTPETDRKINKYPDKQNKTAAKNLASARRNLNSALNKADKALTGASNRKKEVIKANRKIRDEALNEINKARKILGEDEFNAILKKERFRADLIEALKTGAVATVTGPYATPELIRQSVSKQDRVDKLAKKKARGR